MKNCTQSAILLLTIFIFCFGITIAQNNSAQDYQSKVSDPHANFYEIVAEKRAEFAALDLSIKSNEKAMKQFERWAYNWKDRINADGSFPSETNNRLSKDDYIDLLMDGQNANRMTAPWVQVGPVNNPNINGFDAYPGKGRINVITEDPDDSNIMYAGAPAGGVWKTTDNGNSWLPKSDFLAGIGVTDILVDPNNTDIIYIATGDEDGQHVSSIGVFKSIDAGETWSATGLTFSLTENEYINDLAFAPGDPTKIFALTTFEIKVTANSGMTWNNVPTTSPFGQFEERFQTIVFDPNDATKVIVSDFWDGIWVSSDSGANFALHSVYEGVAPDNKLKLTTSADDNDHFYGLSQNGDFRKYRFAIDDTANDLVSSTVVIGDFESQGGYNQVIAVSPTNKMNIIVGGVRSYKSTNGGTSFSVWTDPYDEFPGTGFYVHSDHHHMSFLADGVTVLDGHDGGIHKGPFSALIGTPWTIANDLSHGLNITQPYHIAVTQEVNGDNFMMGNQDNDGFSKILKDGTRQWVSCVAGDGTGVGIDIGNSNIRYLGGVGGSLDRSDNGYATSFDASINILSFTPNAAFVSPMAVHPTVATTIYAAHGDVKKSINRGGAWNSLGSGLTAVDFLEVTPNGASIRIYAIEEGGPAKRSDNDGASWTTITPPAGLRFNSITAQPNTTIAYATVAGYTAGSKVYKTVDNGVNWTALSTGLPNIIMKKVILNTSLTNETLYLGTELGVYTKDNISNWTKMGSDLPNVRIDDLKINYTDQSLYIGSFGRGMWKTSIYVGTCPEIAKVWNGVWAPPGAPNGSTSVTLNASYDTGINGDLNACTLLVSPGSTLNIPAGSFAKVNGNIIANGSITIQHEGSLVQVDDAATVTGIGNISVSKTTPVMAAQSFMILGSPMSTDFRDGVYANSYIVRKHETANFVPNAAVAAAFPMANNFADDDGNNWIEMGGMGGLAPGVGYMVFPQPDGTASGSYTHNYNSGTLNNGITGVNLVYNGTANGSPNILSNPYASAIDADIFFADVANDKIGALYFWEHLTAASVGYPGYNAANFSMADISLYSKSMGGVAAGGATTPTNVIASGQGFAVKPKEAGTALFKNVMRITGPNDTYRSPVSAERDRIWINVKNEAYSLGSTTLIGFSENTSNVFNNNEDVDRLATPVAIYSELTEGQELIVNALGAFDIEDRVNLGFVTQIDEPQQYHVSLQDIDGLQIENEMVYLIDNLSGVVTNLSEGNYLFQSGAGTFSNRFTIVFQNSALGTTESDLESIGIHPNPTQNILNIVSPRIIINQAIIYDLRGRIVGEKTFTTQGNYTINMSNLVQSMYFITLETSNGSITKRVLKR